MDNTFYLRANSNPSCTSGVHPRRTLDSARGRGGGVGLSDVHRTSGTSANVTMAHSVSLTCAAMRIITSGGVKLWVHRWSNVPPLTRSMSTVTIEM